MSRYRQPAEVEQDTDEPGRRIDEAVAKAHRYATISQTLAVISVILALTSIAMVLIGRL